MDNPIWNKPRKPAWIPAEWLSSDVAALKSVWSGTANADEQRRALMWILESASGVGEPPFRSEKDGGERETSFHLGRQFVGQQIQKLIGMPVGLIAKVRELENAERRPEHPAGPTKLERSGS